ncbi:MATH and LRR domain-containing protein PFE0570w-like isoform X2 [Pseudomyrmex gracilis]|uniref:MATH and LRR domain-containing protein PFE0570w-like isoform X2 n=1 Tax=Pseudomyrmex gracilis TaxID=219809 RepID=UPI000995B100|nr:MATH and LRR domain-containing protein PFE0570w-like isoform X2 [Pseudomyrmex gracilis]
MIELAEEMDSISEDTLIARILSQDVSQHSVPFCEEKHRDGEQQTREKIQIRGVTDDNIVNLGNTFNASQVIANRGRTRNNSNDHQKTETQECSSSSEKTLRSSRNVEGEEPIRSTSYVTDTCAESCLELLNEKVGENITMIMSHKIKLNLRSMDKERINQDKNVSLPNEKNNLKIILKRILECPDNNRQSKKTKRDKSYASFNDSNVEPFSENKEDSNKEETQNCQAQNWRVIKKKRKIDKLSSSVSQKSVASTIPAAAAAKTLENSLAHYAADNSDIDSTLSTVEGSEETSLFMNKSIIEENIRNKNKKIDIFVNEADQRHVIQSSQKQQENQEPFIVEHADSTNNVEKQDNEEISSSFSEMIHVEENAKIKQNEIIEINFLNENSRSQKSSSKSSNISTTESSFDVQDNDLNSCDKSQIHETLSCNNTLTKDVMKTVIGDRLPTTTISLSKSIFPEKCSSQNKCVDNEISSVAIADLPSDNCVNESPTTGDGNTELELQIRPKTHSEAIQTFSVKASLDSLNTCLDKYKGNPEALLKLLKCNSITSAEQSEKQQDTQITSENSSESINKCKTSDPKQQSAENRPNGNENTTDEQTLKTKSYGNIKVRSWEELSSPILSSTSQIESNIFNLRSNSQVPSQVTNQGPSCTEYDGIIPCTLHCIKKKFVEVRSAIQNIMISLHCIRSVTCPTMQYSILSKQQVQEMKDNMAKLNTNISKLRKLLHVRSNEDAIKFFNDCTGLSYLTAEKYIGLANLIDDYSQFYKLARGTYLNISHLTNNTSHNFNSTCNKTQMSSQSALSSSYVSPSDPTRTSNHDRSQSSTLSNAFPTNSNISYQQFSTNTRYPNQHASSSYQQQQQQQLANNILPSSYLNKITSPLGAQNANHVSSPPYSDGVTSTSSVQRTNNVPPSSYPNRVISVSFAQQAPINLNNVTYTTSAFGSNNINVSGSACQTNASLNRGMPQTTSSQIVQPDMPVVILPTTQQTVPQQNVANISMKYFVLANKQQNSANLNIQQHSFANPSVPQQQPTNSSMYQRNLANSSVQHQILTNPSLQQRNVVLNPSMQYQTSSNLSVQHTQQESHLTNAHVQQLQLPNLSEYRQNLVNSSKRPQTFANLPTQKNDAASSLMRMQHLANIATYKQNTANPSVLRQLLSANQLISQQNSRQNLCHANCAECLQIVSNNLQNIRKNQNSAHVHTSTGRSDTINNSMTNAPNSVFNSTVEISKLQNNNNTTNKTRNQQDVYQEFTNAQHLSQESSTPIAPQTSTSHNSRHLQDTTCDTLSGKDPNITLEELITSNKFYLDLDFLTDNEKFVLCKQLGSYCKILMWIRKNASRNIPEKLEETIQWSLFLHKYMRHRTNEILKDFYSDNQLEISQDNSTSITETISEENIEVSTTKQLSETRSNVPEEDDSITNTSCNESGAEKTKALDMPEIDKDLNENPETANSNVNKIENMCKTSKNVVINIENKDNAHSSCNNEDQIEKVDNVLNDVQITHNNNNEENNQFKPRSQSIISYAPRSSTPIASSNNLKLPSLNECKCTRISQTCVHCKHIVEIMGLHFDTEEDNNEKALAVASFHDTSDEGCDFDPERLVIDEQDSTITCNEEDNHLSDATLSQSRVLENDAEADSCQTTANEAQDTSNINQKSSIQSADTDVISTEDAMRKKENVDTHSGVKTINKIFERVTVYKRYASPRIPARKLRVQLESTNVKRYASNEDDSLSSECASNTDCNTAILQSLSDTDNHDKEDSKDNCEAFVEKSDDKTWTITKEDNDKLTTKNDTHTPYFNDYEMISDYEEDAVVVKTEDDVTLQSPDTNVKEDTEDALDNESVPKIEKIMTPQPPVAEENQNKEEYKDNCKVSSEESNDEASNNINKKEKYESTKINLHTNYITDNEEISHITEHRVLSPKTEDDIELEFSEDAIMKEDILVEDELKNENVPGAENAPDKYVPNTEENVTLQPSFTAEKQIEEECRYNCEPSVEESDGDISKKDSDKLVTTNENRTSCSNETNAEEDVTLLEEFQFDENNILSPETTYQIEDAFNNKLVIDTELGATLQLRISTEDRNKEEHNNDDHDVSSNELSNNSEENIMISESDVRKLSCDSEQNDEVEILPTILQVQSISESMFNEIDNIICDIEIAQNNAKKLDSKNEISQVNVEEVDVEEENKTDFFTGDNNNTKSDNEHIPCLRCKRTSTVYCEACLSATYCSKRCASLHWKSKHQKLCTRKYDPL